MNASTRHAFVLSLFGLAVFVSAPLAAADDNAKEVAMRLRNKNAGWGDMRADLEMKIEDPRGGTTSRKMHLRALEVRGEGTGHTLLTFDSPADVRGTSLLSRGGGDGQQLLYLPATKRVRRISGTKQTGAFMGSDFSYEDIRGLDPKDFSFHTLGEVKCGDLTCVRIKAVPNVESGYAYRVLSIERSTDRLQRVEFMTNDDKVLKTLVHSGYKQFAVGGAKAKVWRATTWTMKNHTTGRATTLVFSNYKFENAFKDADFTQAALMRAR